MPEPTQEKAELKTRAQDEDSGTDGKYAAKEENVTRHKMLRKWTKGKERKKGKGKREKEKEEKEKEKEEKEKEEEEEEKEEKKKLQEVVTMRQKEAKREFLKKLFYFFADIEKKQYLCRR